MLAQLYVIYNENISPAVSKCWAPGTEAHISRASPISVLTAPCSYWAPVYIHFIDEETEAWASITSDILLSVWCTIGASFLFILVSSIMMLTFLNTKKTSINTGKHSLLLLIDMSQRGGQDLILLKAREPAEFSRALLRQMYYSSRSGFPVGLAGSQSQAPASLLFQISPLKPIYCNE